MTIELVDTEAGFDKLESGWQRLAHDATIFNSYSWQRKWWQYFGDGELCILVVRSAGEILGICPLYRRVVTRGGVPFKQLCLIGTGGPTSPDYLDMIAVGPYRKICAKLFAEKIAELDWSWLSLQDCPHDSALIRALGNRESGVASGGIVRQLEIYYERLPATWESYRASLSKNTRSQINRRWNKLLRLGDISVTMAGRDNWSEAFNALIKLHRARWQVKGEAGTFTYDRYNAFHSALIESLIDEGAIWLISIRHRGVPIAVMYWYLWNGTLSFFQSGIDPEHADLAVGHNVMVASIQRAIEEGVGEIDMLKGAYPYKRSYARCTRLTVCWEQHRGLSRGFDWVWRRARALRAIWRARSEQTG